MRWLEQGMDCEEFQLSGVSKWRLALGSFRERSNHVQAQSVSAHWL